MQQVEGDEWYEMGMDVSTVARDKLANLLKDYLEELTGIDFTNPDDNIGATQDRSTENLRMTLLAMSIGHIRFAVIAEALLVAAGKWAPDCTVPDWFPLPDEETEVRTSG
jgi:hypothetical protein